MLFSFNKNGRVGNFHSVQQLENVHLRTSHVDTASKLIVLTSTISFEGNMDFESFNQRLTDTISNNPSFVRFRSKYNDEANSWTPIDGWSPKQNCFCHKDSASEEALQQAEARSVERIQTMKDGSAWECHFKYHPVTDETTIRWVLSHSLGDGYAIRSFFVSLLDGYVKAARPNLQRAPLGTSVYRTCNDIRLAKQWKPLNKKLAPTCAPMINSFQQAERVHPIEFPPLSLQKIKSLAKENKVTMQDLLFHILAETKRRIGESEDDWLGCAFNQRGLKQLNRMDNISAVVPVYIGDGDLRTIHRSTKMIKGSNLVTYKGHQRVNKTLGKTNCNAPPQPPQDRILCLINMVGILGDNNTLFGHKVRSLRFHHANLPNFFDFISCGKSLFATFTIEESKRTGRGELVRKTFMMIVEEMDLLSDSRQREAKK